MINLLDYDAEGLTRLMAELGEKPFRARQLLKWMHQGGAGDFAAMSDLARGLREKLAAGAVIEPPALLADRLAADGTRKWLLQVAGGSAIEVVFIPEAGRSTLCVSSQVGCALGCTFCATGAQGFNRNLGVAEIVGQLWWANRTLGGSRTRRVISNVVFMGMGEPLLNLDAVVPALRIMLDDNAYGLSRRRVTVSTAGSVPGMDRLRQECPVALAVSLHAPTDALRDKLVPLNRKYPLKELMAACRRYLEDAPRESITFEYVLLDGVNDGARQARELTRLLEGVPCKVNLIPFNPFPATGYRRSPPEAVRHFQEALMGAGLITTVRKTRGDDIEAACGQLAGRVPPRARRAPRGSLEAA